MPPRLVQDVLRIVFETAARADRRSALNLALVNKTSQGWIDRILYETVRLRYQRTTNNLLRTLETSMKPPSFFAKQVKSLAILYDIRPGDVERIVAVCGGIQNITSWFLPTRPAPGAAPARAPGPLARFMGPLRPKHLSSWHGILTLPDPHLALPFFSEVTHLTVVNAWEEWCSWPWPHDALEALTHLSLDFTFGARALASSEIERMGGALMHILSVCPALKVCGLRIDQRESAPSVVEVAEYFDKLREPRVLLYRNREPFQIREARSENEMRFWATLTKNAKDLAAAEPGVGRRIVAINPATQTTRLQIRLP
uniref:F-box domain-containing protein n=1 Tax=Mycena chlorophos TaxID=658473 RepID=A0ABQ0MA27_MYCCL|nr:predicted protein [Mycena chlorophos]